MKRWAAAVLAAGLVVLSCTACDDDSESGGASLPTELSDIQSTLNGIDSDMAGDGNP